MLGKSRIFVLFLISFTIALQFAFPLVDVTGDFTFTHEHSQEHEHDHHEHAETPHSHSIPILGDSFHGVPGYLEPWRLIFSMANPSFCPFKKIPPSEPEGTAIFRPPIV